MRIRTMKLPSQVTGDTVQTPFLIVVDKCNIEELDAEAGEGIKSASGAAGVLVFAGAVEIGDPA